MARKSGFGTAVKIVKAVNRAQKQAARENERERKQQIREYEKQQREEEKMLRLREKENLAKVRSQILLDKAHLKKLLANAKNSYENRCLERKTIGQTYINMELK